MLHTPLAYKFVMSVAMIAFVNHYALKLNLPIDVPLKQEKIQRLGVRLPENNKVQTFYAGGIRVNNYAFGFSDGTLENQPFVCHFTITKLEDDGMTSFGIPLLRLHEPSNSLMERASRMKYTITTNDLYRIGTNYFAALDIDPIIVKTNNSFIVEQGIFHSNRGLVPSPLMNIYWKSSKLRDPGSNGVACLISAVSGDLLEMNAGNSCDCKGLPLIKNFEKLITIPDEEFLKYSDTERSNIVSRFVTCPSLITPEAMSLGLFYITNNIARINAQTVKQ